MHYIRIMRGSYLLIIKLENDNIIPIGKLGEIPFKKGFYVYVGSALNGLEQRIQRHMRKNKKIHWHIDYFLKHARIINVWCKENTFREECIIANELDVHLSSITGFGCSDCNCKSHLFYGTYNEIKHIIDGLNMNMYSSNANY